MSMNDYIAEQISRGASLSEMVRDLEEAYHSECAKRQEEEKREAEINAALKRAAAATADYYNIVTNGDHFESEMFEIMLSELVDSAQMVAQMVANATKAKKNAAAQTRGIMNPRVEVIHNGVEDKDAEDKLMQFLIDMGLIS